MQFGLAFADDVGRPRECLKRVQFAVVPHRGSAFLLGREMMARILELDGPLSNCMIDVVSRALKTNFLQ